MKRSFAAYFLLAAMVFGLWGCGQKEQATAPEETTEAPKEEITAPEVATKWVRIKTTVMYGEKVTGTTEFAYDGFGNLILTSNSDHTKTTYSYDSAGRQVREESYSYLTRENYWECTYDESGNMTTKIYYTDDETSREEYTYSVTGQLERKVWRYGEEERVEEYTYDSQGRLVECRYPAISGTMLRDIYIYISKDNSFEKYTYSGEDCIRHEVQTYYNDGTLFRTLTRDLDDSYSWSETVYNTSGEKLMYLRYDRYGEDLRNEWVYDEQGRLVEWISTEGRQEQYRYEYIYDENGNLIEEIHYRQGEETSRGVFTYMEISLPA